MARNQEIPIQELLDALLDTNTPFSPRYLYRLSDLEGEDLAAVQKIWPQVPTWRRQAIMEDIENLGESDYVLSFEAFARSNLQDSDPRVRELAIRALWDYESPDLVPILLNMLEKDQDANVRATAASALGKYIYLGEVEELPERTLHQIEDRLLAITQGSDTALVRRRALEALGYSSREEVNALIESAFNSGNHDWIVSALFAMGRSANPDWSERVLSMLENDAPEICYEAARAAGELEIKEAVPRLLNLLNSQDAEVRMAAIWSLSQIGGSGVRQRLEALYYETEDDDEADFIEQALDNLDFTEGSTFFTLMDVSDLEEMEEEEDEDYWDEEDDEFLSKN